MKQLFLFIALIGLSLSSCKKDNKAENISLLGKWKIEKNQIKMYQDNKLESDDTTNPVGDYVDFRTDVDLFIFVNNELKDYAYIYLKDEKKISIVGDDGTTVSNILEFTRNRLVLQTEYNNPDYKMRIEVIQTLSR